MTHDAEAQQTIVQNDPTKAVGNIPRSSQAVAGALWVSLNLVLLQQQQQAEMALGRVNICCASKITSTLHSSICCFSELRLLAASHRWRPGSPPGGFGTSRPGWHDLVGGGSLCTGLGLGGGLLGVWRAEGFSYPNAGAV